MVARGDLGLNLPPEQVPIIQKRLIKSANKHGKPVITATQVLQSMVDNPLPTRAEISDAANAVYDHTDAIMLSNETAVGKHPTKATKTLSKVSLAVEKEIHSHEDFFGSPIREQCLPTDNPLCLNACELAIDTHADFFIIYTTDGYSAREIAKHRLFTELITITPSTKTARELTLVWGLNKILVAKLDTKSTDNIVKFLKRKKIIKTGNQIVIICNASKKEKLISTLKV